MRAGARVAAAIDILTDLERRRRPAAEAVKDWMLSHRFAGSRDRSEIGDLVFCALRWKASSAWRFGDDTPRAWVWGAQRWGLGTPPEAIKAACENDPHAPPPPSALEMAALCGGALDNAPAWVRGDYPEWVDASLARAFGDDRAQEGAALAAPAPLDLRANTLKTTSLDLLEALNDSPRLHQPALPCRFAPHGVRIPWTLGRSFQWAGEPSYVRGWFEVQDEGSQLAAMLAGAQPGMQVADVCAGGGGKTLAMAAEMRNTGQLFAFDIDAERLAPIKTRLERAAARNVQVRWPARSRDALSDLYGRMDLVMVDAPCTGSGTWRRAPDAKWRLRPGALERRRADQQAALDLAALLVKPGGRLVYVTCSVLPEENEDALDAFLRRTDGFSVAPIRAAAEAAFGASKALSVLAHAWSVGKGVQFTPLSSGCDGFFVSVLRRSA